MILSTSDDNNEILPRFPTPQPCHLRLQEQKCPLGFIVPKGRVPPQGFPKKGHQCERVPAPQHGAEAMVPGWAQPPRQLGFSKHSHPIRIHI